ncbi:GntR family transcriptional regulator [Streptomyces sp. R02]|uniref:GntR family transcriptional regulator n=1 Tax=Streptomyces sp. R02 TaxID=3238623 RepID=A0AB39LX21_9ACTN
MTTDVSVVRDGTGMPGAAARVPKYSRVQQPVVEITESLTPGERLPAERLLALRPTSRAPRSGRPRARGQGRLDRIQGKGTFIARPKLYRTLQLSSCTEDMLARGLRPASRILDLRHTKTGEELSRLLAIGIGEEVVLIGRLRPADDESMAIESTHLSARRFPDLLEKPVRYRSLHTALAKVYGVRLSEAEEGIETTLANPYEAELLSTVVGLPMMLLSRHSHDGDGGPVEWVRSVHRGSRCNFVAALFPTADRASG